MDSSPEFKGYGRRRTYSSGSEASDHFISINERPVDDISIDLFYRPHTVSLLILTITGLIYFCFTRDETASLQSNIQVGMQAAIFFFLIISVLAFPNGPFTRPHPAVWRIVFGLSVLYMLLLIFILFQDYKTVRGICEWFFPELKNFTIDMDKGEWGEKCDDFSPGRLWESIDFFCFAHFAGWAMKTVLVRHYGICWTISVLWELTEIFFSHLLPNFKECWWDSFILDVAIFNGLGIWFGMQFCNWMEMRYFKWESIKDIQTTSGKLKRAVMQFTPESWTTMRWLDPASTSMRFLAVTQLIMFWQVSELNTFFLKHIFQMPPNHPIVFIRIFLLGAISAPSIRQYYSYVTDPRCKRVGTQAWVYGLCMSVETIICFKFGRELFAQTQFTNIIGWLAVMLTGSIICVYVCVEFQKWNRKRKYAKHPRYANKGLTPDQSPRKSVTLSTPEFDFEDERIPYQLDDDFDDEEVVRQRYKSPRQKSEQLRAAREQCSGSIGDDESEDSDRYSPKQSVG